jgi:HlyD family secretion protein
MLNKSENTASPEQRLSEVGKGSLVGEPVASSVPERGEPKPVHSPSRTPATIVTFIVAAVVGLTLWYLVQPQPLTIQGEADATRIDIAARVDGRVAKRPVSRGQNVAAGEVLFEIENPELLTRLREAEAAKIVAAAELAHIEAGTRAEVVAQRKASIDSADANRTLAKLTYDRTKQLVAEGHAPLQRLDEVTDQLEVARRSTDQAKLEQRPDRE